MATTSPGKKLFVLIEIRIPFPKKDDTLVDVFLVYETEFNCGTLS